MTKNNLIDQHPKWNYDEFCVFLMLYAGMADMELSEEEEKLCLNRVDQDTYESIKDEFNEANDYEVAQIILSYQGLHFPTEDRKRELISLLEKEFNADGEFSTMERNLEIALNKLL